MVRAADPASMLGTGKAEAEAVATLETEVVSGENG